MGMNSWNQLDVSSELNGLFSLQNDSDIYIYVLTINVDIIDTSRNFDVLQNLATDGD